MMENSSSGILSKKQRHCSTASSASSSIISPCLFFMFFLELRFPTHHVKKYRTRNTTIAIATSPTITLIFESNGILSNSSAGTNTETTTLITKDRRVMIQFLARSVSAIFSNKLMRSLLSSNILINEGALVLLQFFDFCLLDGNQSVNLRAFFIKIVCYRSLFCQIRIWQRARRK